MRTIPEGFNRADLQGQVRPGQFSKLNWVGMSNIALPISLSVGGDTWKQNGNISVYASLDSEDHRGIHMSRLYTYLQTAFLDSSVWTVVSLEKIARELLQTQKGISKDLKLSLKFDLPLERKALVTEASGLRSYPVEIELRLMGDSFHLGLGSEIVYSSTCPCSAGLSRELNFEAFQNSFSENESPSKEEVLTWLKSEESVKGTPHAQRSTAEFRVQLGKSEEEAPIELLQSLVVGLEEVMATPVQTLVKREDEKAFAAANASNLMFCEDAARRAKSFFEGQKGVEAYHCRVSHLESLHAHDAVAEVASGTLQSFS